MGYVDLCVTHKIIISRLKNCSKTKKRYLTSKSFTAFYHFYSMYIQFVCLCLVKNPQM